MILDMHIDTDEKFSSRTNLWHFLEMAVNELADTNPEEKLEGDLIYQQISNTSYLARTRKGASKMCDAHITLEIKA